MRTYYTQEEKQAVIDRVISGELSTHILADTGIPKSTFYGWLRAYREEQEADNRRTVSIRNFHLLENKVARLESIVEILKCALHTQGTFEAKAIRCRTALRQIQCARDL